MELRDVLQARYISSILLHAALGYLSRGWSVIPIKGKLPMCPWKAFQDARAEEGQISEWFSRSAPTGLGIVTGAISNLFVLDVDVGLDKAGQESLGRLQVDHEALPDTLRVRTGGGGLHLYFRYPEGVEIRNSAGLKDYPGLDIRANGGYVAAPPSKHPSGNRYKWDDTGAKEPAEAPPWLIDLVKEDRSHGDQKNVNAPHPSVKIEPIVDGCGFIRHCHDDAASLSEEEWFSMLSIVGRCEGGDKLALEWSKPYPAFDPKETLKKLNHAVTSAGPRTCEHISRHGGDDFCLHCPHRGHIKSPVVLGSTGGGATNIPVGSERFTDMGNARRLVDQYGDKIRHVREWGWLAWDGQRWKRNGEKEVQRFCKDIARSIVKEAEDNPTAHDADRLLKHGIRSSDHHKLMAMMRCAESEREIDAIYADFDRNEWLLNVANGTIDLKEGTLRPHSLQDMITKLAPVQFDPDAECPLFMKFLERIFRGQLDLIPFLQRVFGYTLTGSGEERYFFILHGNGRNGKTTLLEAIRHVVGEYAGTIPISALTKSRNVNNSGPTPELASLQGKRFVTSSEAEEGQRLAESLVKLLTGNGQVVARALYDGMTEFSTTFKLFLDCNYIPEIRGGDDAIWDRTIIIPFNERIADDELNRRLLVELKQEAPGILAWAVQGCLRYQEYGLDPPIEVTLAGQQLRMDSDPYCRFLEECCVILPGTEVSFQKLYDAFCAFSKDKLGWQEPVSQNKFARKMKSKNLDRVKRDGGRAFYKGIGLLAEI